jgi:DNA-binding IclR family transcriptional regulator
MRHAGGMEYSRQDVRVHDPWGAPMTEDVRLGRNLLSDLVGSVQRALRVLEVVAENPDGIPAKAVARRLDMALSTTYHLLNTLVAEGYVVHLEDTRGFGLGYKIPTLYRSFREKLAVSPALATALAETHTRAKAAAYYAVYRDTDIVVAHIADSPEAARIEPLDVGFNEAAHALAFGKVLLASLTPADRREYLDQHGLPAFTDKTVTGRAELERELEEVVASGVANDVEEFRAGLACVAAPVFGLDGTVVGCVSVSVAAETIRDTRETLAALVRQGAIRTARALALES